MAKKTREMSAIERAFDAGWKARTAIYTEDSRIGYHEALGNYLRENMDDRKETEEQAGTADVSDPYKLELFLKFIEQSRVEILELRDGIFNDLKKVQEENERLKEEIRLLSLDYDSEVRQLEKVRVARDALIAIIRQMTDNREIQIRKAIDLAREGEIFGWPDSSPDDAEYVFKLTTDEILKKIMNNDD